MKFSENETEAYSEQLWEQYENALYAYLDEYEETGPELHGNFFMRHISFSYVVGAVEKALKEGIAFFWKHLKHPLLTNFQTYDDLTQSDDLRLLSKEYKALFHHLHLELNGTMDEKFEFNNLHAELEELTNILQGNAEADSAVKNLSEKYVQGNQINVLAVKEAFVNLKVLFVGASSVINIYLER